MRAFGAQPGSHGHGAGPARIIAEGFEPGGSVFQEASHAIGLGFTLMNARGPPPRPPSFARRGP